MTDFLDVCNNKLNLLFKNFQGVAQAQIKTSDTGAQPYSQETLKSLNNIFQQDVFTENIPLVLPKTLFQLWNDNSIPTTTWNTTISDQSLSFVDLSDNSGNAIPIRFYKGVYLDRAAGLQQSWWYIDPSSNGDAIPENNVLHDMIPWKYNGKVANMYTPVLEFYDTVTTSWQRQQQNTTSKTNWLIDYPTGLVEFYQSSSILSNNGVGTPAATSETDRPRISFIKYTGKKLAQALADISGGSGGGAGTIEVAEISGNTIISSQDVSAIRFDNSDFDISFSGTNATVSFVSGGGGGGSGLTDLSYYFFDVPNALTNGFGDVSGGSAIDLSWSLPPQTKSALPFGSALQYPTGLSSEQILPILHVPFFKELRIQYKDFTTSQDFTVGWTDLSINNAQQTTIPPTVNKAILSSTGTTGATLNGPGGSTTAPFTVYLENGSLVAGSSYQFRLFLVNEGDEPGIVDPVYGLDASYNYLYIPDVSGGSIALGSFGFPTSPTSLTFTTTAAFDDIDLFGINSDPSGADTSLNIPFPINPQLGLQVRFGFDISGIPDPASLQMPNVKNTTLLEGAYLSPYQLTNSITVDESQLTSGNITWYPETKYVARDFFMQNNALDTSNVLAYMAPPDPSYVSIIPSRSQVGALTSRIPSGSLSYPDPGGITKTNAYPISNNSLISNIYFMDPADSFTLSMSNSYTFANNLVPTTTTAHRGTDSIGIDLTRFQLEVVAGATSINTATSTALQGYLDVSFVTLSQNTLELSANSVEGSNLGNPAKGHGYYTNGALNNIRITPVSLATYPDICNNSYLDYEFTVTDEYRNPANTTFITGNALSTNFRTAKKPTTDIAYAVNTSLNPLVTLDFNFFGQLLPSTSATQYSVPFTYDLTGIDLWWRAALNISTSEILYAPNVVGQETNAGKPIVTEPWDAAPSKTGINPQQYITAGNVWIKGNSVNQAQRYSRSVTSVNSNQFGIETIATNNITRTPTTNTYLHDVSFGISPGKFLWWDFTWENNPSGTSASSTPTGVLPGGASLINPLGSGRNASYSNYDHTLVLPDIQLMWANGAFRSAGNSSSSSDYPYIDFSANYYNPSNNKLRDYSGKTSTGDSISLTCSSLNPTQQWWNNTGFTGTISRTIKFVTFNITMPYTSNIQGGGGSAYGYVLTITNSAGGTVQHDSSTSGTPNGYWVYHTEDGASGYNPSSGTGFNGQWGVNVVSGGIGSWNTALNNNSGGYEVQDVTNGGTQTEVQISVGLPINLVSSISSIGLTWVKA